MVRDVNLVVGAGISGATIARQIAEQWKEPVCVVEARTHVGGNCHDYTNADGILVPKYGPHFFHTNSRRVWEYVARFGEWNGYQHRVLSRVNGEYVPVPVNIVTVNKLLGEKIRSTAEMERWLRANTVPCTEPRNSEQAALSRVGPKLYELLFRNYTRKQWDLDPCELDPAVLNRIPVRTDYEDRYFTDEYQGMPVGGYTALFTRLLDHPLITVSTSSRYVPRAAASTAVRVFYTGRIDRYFGHLGEPPLAYRSLRFEFQTHETESLQPACTVNYPEPSVAYTRTTEPKQATGQQHRRTTIVEEYPTADGEPFYPVLTLRNLSLYARYQELAANAGQHGVYFVGRLAQYKYLNMDQAFENAIALCDRIAGNTSVHEHNRTA